MIKSVIYAFEKLAQSEAWLKKTIQALMQKPLRVKLRFNHWLHGVGKEAVDVDFAFHFPIFRLFIWCLLYAGCIS